MLEPSTEIPINQRSSHKSIKIDDDSKDKEVFIEKISVEVKKEAIENALQTKKVQFLKRFVSNYLIVCFYICFLFSLVL